MVGQLGFSVNLRICLASLIYQCPEMCMMMNESGFQNMLKNIKKGMKLLNREGLIAFLWKFFVYMTNFQRFSILKCHIDRVNYAPPKKEGYELKIVSSIESLNELLDNDYLIENDILKECERDLKNKLIGFLVFYNKEIAHTRWVVTSEARTKTNTHPLTSIAENELFVCNAFTTPKYRGLHLHSYVLGEISNHFRENYEYIVLVVLGNNIPALKADKRAGFKIYGEHFDMKLRFLQLRLSKTRNFIPKEIKIVED